MKNFIMSFVVGLLSIESFAQVEGEMPAYSYEDWTETIAVLLDREMGLPVCRFSNEVRINPESVKFLPKERIDDTRQVNIDEVRICQQKDVWLAALNNEEIVIAIAFPNISGLMSHIVPGIAFVAGILCDHFEGTENDHETWEKFEKEAYFGISAVVVLHILTKLKEFFPFFPGTPPVQPHYIFFNPFIGTGVTVLGIASCIL